MKQNKVLISVTLYETPERHTHDSGAVTVQQDFELPVAAPGDAGFGQISTALRGFERHLFKQLEQLGVIAVESDKVAQEVTKEVASAIDPDPQSVITCPKCRGQGWVHSEPPLSTDSFGNIEWSKVECDNCGGFGKVGV
ncbi:zinc binding domain protein [Pantoea phage Kyle]|uniref:Zinc binding domain protein n=1 Tax=Pantoea phage Kyle TaxID=2589665 RepID=A0A514A8R2_9CAUD|nr:zinc binding domain protein [Pantoea phage Kyle]QDH49661.1 zinc binding domain protein [Pantoea phage Kyle]